MIGLTSYKTGGGQVRLRYPDKPMNSELRISILVAEDSEDNRFLLQAYCRNTPYDLTFAEDGEKAVAAFQAGTFEMIVIDVQMPILDGLAATRQIRNLEAARGSHRIPILALTANVMPDDILLAQEAGCNLHISKPISKKAFLSALEHWSSVGAGAKLASQVETCPAA